MSESAPEAEDRPVRPPLVMLHGWASSPAVWHAMRSSMGGSPAQAPALPGNPGGADGLAPRLDDWSAAVLAGLPPRFDLCGWSLGGLLAIGIALAAPERVRRIALIGTSPCFCARADWPHALDGAVVAGFRADFADRPARVLSRFHALQCLGDARRRTVADGLAQAAAPAAGSGGLAAGLQVLDETDIRPRLAELRQPVRVLHGADDALIPAAAAAALCDGLANARLTMLEDCGHAPQLSRPQDCAGLLDGFLGEPDR
ncbi:MAG: alpha/beta fold hydrolase [Rhodocyclaceae bacterium]|nr:alpha/beta fold hydrolase [Rhodocyclaceae bacterium]